MKTGKKPGKLKIAMLGQKRIPSREGGVEIVVEELAVRMAALGHDVTCLNRSGDHVSGAQFNSEEHKRLKEYKGVHLKSVPTLQKKGLAAASASLTAALATVFHSYDVVHFHAEGPCVMLWLPKLFGRRCIATIHGLDWQRAKWGGFASRYIRLGEQVAARWADEIIVLSENVRNYFLQTYGRETRFVPNGVNRPAILDAAEISSLYGLRKDSYCLFLGRIVPEKGIHYLIEAWEKLHTDKLLVIAGGASDTDDYWAELQKHKSDRILFTGFVQGRVLEELYSNAYLYCLPSDLEGMPLSLLEAMSYGNCCLVSDIPECAEVVEDHAAVFRHGDTEHLRTVLQELLDQPELVQQYKQQAADFITAKYNWDKVARTTLQIYTGENTHEKA